jgi:hypothetical protein
MFPNKSHQMVGSAASSVLAGVSIEYLGRFTKGNPVPVSE